MGGSVVRPFRYTDAGGLTTPLPANLAAYGDAINAAGVIAGGSSFGEPTFLAAPGQPWVPYRNVLLNGAPLGPSEASSINNLGQFAGVQHFGVGAFAYDPALGARSLGTLAGPQFTGGTSARGIDDNGRVVGEASLISGRNYGRAIVAYNASGPMSDLNDLKAPGGPFSELAIARAVNTSFIVGTGYRPDGKQRGFRMRADGSVDEIPMPSSIPPEGAGWTDAMAVNNRGDIAGTYAYGASVAFVFTNEGQMIDLKTLVDPSSGWALITATGITDSLPRLNGGVEVVGWGTHGSGPPRAFKMKLPDLSPCPALDSAHGSGTRNPADGQCTYPTLLTLRIDGIVDTGNGSGPYIAVFGYDSGATTNIELPPGDETNSVLRNASRDPAPLPSPPTTFLPGSHVGVFLPKFNSGDTITWKIPGDSRSASATNGVPQLTPIPFGTDGLQVCLGGGEGESCSGGYLLTVRPDTGVYTTPPENPALQPAPDQGAAFNGDLAGQLTVTPSGASVYTVPISVPAGIGGIVPVLNLIYSSQGGNGIAGQGWEMSGLSMIHRCPKTRAQDGFARPIVMDAFPNPTSSDDSDGICMDGQRLFEVSHTATTYTFTTERPDFSSITYYTADKYFLVRTKAYEFRYYGLTAKSRITTPRGSFDTTAAASTQREVAVWGLSRVVDDWGNFLEITYNGNPADPDAEFALNGMHVSKIDYTGHVPAGSASPAGWDPDSDPFHSIEFSYESRTDVRWARFGVNSVPKNQRLKSIATPTGQYSFLYHDPNDLVPSRLREIKYCAKSSPSTCLEPLKFEWEPVDYGWDIVSNANYVLPSIDTDDSNGNLRFFGSQWADVNGDGLFDVVTGGVQPQLGLNTGQSIALNYANYLPGALMKSTPSSDGAARALLADVDGDGRLDFIENVAAGQGSGVWMNRGDTSNGWVKSTTFRNVPRDFGRSGNPDRIADMNGDGKADLIAHQGTANPYVGPGQRVYLSTGEDWIVPTEGTYEVFDGATTTTGSSNPYFLPLRITAALDHPEDINRDGLMDIVETNPSDGGWHTFLNMGSVAHGEVIGDALGTSRGSYHTLWKATKFPAYPGAGVDPGNKYYGDLDGDGLSDQILYTRKSSYYAAPAGCGGVDEESFPCTKQYYELSGIDSYVALSTGFGFQVPDGTNFRDQLFLMNYELPPSGQREGITGRLAFADVNADGLTDLLNFDTKELWVNTGKDWRRMLNLPALPMVPARHQHWSHPLANPDLENDNGVAYVDLDGDGVVEIVWADSESHQTIWKNRFKPAVIKGFPNGRAVNTEVTYDAYSQYLHRPANSLAESATVADGTARMPIALRVVTKVLADNGVGGKMATTYGYHNLRTSTKGAGPLGFGSVVVTDPQGIVTTTTYSQVHPYAGLPKVIEVKSPLSRFLLRKTENCYCDGGETNGDALTCTSEEVGGSVLAGPRNFVYPRRTVDTVHLTQYVTSPDPDESTTTTTDNRYDAQGNLTRTTVSTSGLGETYVKEVRNLYNGTTEFFRGKVTQSTVTAQKTAPSAGPITTRISNFEYGYFGSANSYALAKTISEKNAGPGLELHTVYDYDNFGNVIATTRCANSFTDCQAGPSTDGARLHRTEQVSYDSGWLTSAGFLGPLPTYGNGRFPTMITDAAGHKSYRVFDPVIGVPLEDIDANRLHTRYSHTLFGRLSQKQERSGSGAPIDFFWQVSKRGDDSDPRAGTCQRF